MDDQGEALLGWKDIGDSSLGEKMSRNLYIYGETERDRERLKKFKYISCIFFYIVNIFQAYFSKYSNLKLRKIMFFLQYEHILAICLAVWVFVD